MVKLSLIMVMNGTRGLLEDLAATYNFSEEDQYRIENAKSDLLSEVKKLDTVTSYVGKPIDYDTACEIANKLLDDKEQLKKELDELKEKVADQRIDLESSRWYQTVQSDSIIKLRTEIEEREKLNYEAKDIITKQRSKIEKLRGLLRDVYKETDTFLVRERTGFSELGWHQRAAEFDNLLIRINAALGESEEK